MGCSMSAKRLERFVIKNNYDQIVHLVFDSKNIDASQLRKARDRGDKHFIFLGAKDFDKDGRVTNILHDKFRPLEGITRYSKIKIYGHSGPGSSEIFSDPWGPGPEDDDKFNYRMVANVLDLIPKESSARQYSSGQLLKISIIACEGGAKRYFSDPDNPGNASFAERLSKYLTPHIFCTVQGAKTLITTRTGYGYYVDTSYAGNTKGHYRFSNSVLRNFLGHTWEKISKSWDSWVNEMHYKKENHHYSNKAHKTVFKPEPDGTGGYNIVETSPLGETASSTRTMIETFGYSPENMQSAEAFGYSAPAAPLAIDQGHLLASKPFEQPEPMSFRR